MLTGPQQKFCEGVVSGLNGTEAYAAAYPKASRKAAESGASRLLKNENVQAEITRMRKMAEEKAGSAVLTLAEKRIFLARIVRAKVSELPHDSDLWQSIKNTKDGTEYRLCDKLAAMKADNDLAGEGSEAGMNNALSALLGELRK